MPFNKLHVPHDLPSDLCIRINGVLHDALVKTCGANPQDDFCLITRYSANDRIFHPTFLGVRDPQATIVIEIALLGGRTDAQKETLYAEVRRGVAELGLSPDDLIIFLIENRPIDWSFSSEGSVKTVLNL